ncbi:MAG TPA: 50S ribosomal L9 C-terminal domain-containing protein, partial [Pseudonocardia sp.]|nr:50S ribosomal L9 C-terminal domain-containing protein [Pseudonocardia sp.]
VCGGQKGGSSSTGALPAGGPALDRRAVDVPGQIKTIGKHPVTVRLHPEVTTELEIAVVAN